VGPDGEPPPVEKTEGLSLAATQAGIRVGTLRSLARTQLQADTDTLTGLPNRRSTTEALADALRNGGPVSVAMIDLDDFKRLNDAHGHEAGDRALRAFAAATRRTLRGSDTIGRWGGEEFLVVMPGVGRVKAAEVLDRVRLALAGASLASGIPPITISVGVSDTEIALEADELIRRADEALLAAKLDGKDRVFTAEPDGPPHGPYTEPNQAPLPVDSTATPVR
jgi:diguanylate cyclase (GGDEF)-like protein